MKQPSLIMKVVMAVLLIGVGTYFGIYLYRSYQGGVTTVIAYEDWINDGERVTALLVRPEVVVSSPSVSGHQVSLDLMEGEKVAVNGLVATLYSSSSGRNTQQQISALEHEISQMQHILNSIYGIGDAAQLDSDIQSAIVRVRSNLTEGNLSSLENDSLNLRRLIFQREYAYGNLEAADQLASRIEDKEAQVDRLYAGLGAVSTRLYSPSSGTFSSVTDGFEELVTPDSLEDMTVSELQSMLERKRVEDPNAVGKVITSTQWFLAAALPREQAEKLHVGQTCSVSFNHEWTGEAQMTVERVGDDEEGETIVVLSCRDHMADTAYLRQQTVEIVVTSYHGLHVPSNALRAETQTITNSDGQTEERTVTGVYVLVGANAEFKPVNVLWRGQGYYIVEPIDPPNAKSVTADRLDAIRLQAGDEIIVYTAGLYDGKVVR